MTTTRHTPLPFGGPLTSAAMESPLSQLDTAIVAAEGALTAETAARAAAVSAGDTALGARLDAIIIGSGTSDAETIDARGGYATLGAKVRAGAFDVRDYWQAGDTDWAPALQRANDVAAVTGGTVTAAAGVLDLAARVVFSEGVSLRCSLGGVYGAGTVFRCTTAAAGLSFGTRLAAGWSAKASDFLVDGNAVATNPLYIGVGSNATILRVFVSGAAAGDAGVRVESAQNFQWIGGLIQNNAGPGMLIDSGAGGLALYGVGINDNIGANLIVRETYGDGPYALPSHITFDHCVIERNAVVGANTWPRILVSHGEVIRFRDCAIEGGSSAVATVHTLMEIGVAGQYPTVSIDGGRIIGRLAGGGGGGTRAINHVIGRLVISGDTELVAHEVGLTLGTAGAVIADRLLWNNVTAHYTGAGSVPALTRRVQEGGESLRLPGAGDVVLYVGQTTDSGMKLQVDTAGTLGWAGGSGWTPDVTIYRYATGHLNVDGLLTATKLSGAALGVGNSAAATTPGSVVKKIQIFDVFHGTSLGYIAVYDTIT
jgi:hypothetical protein